VTPRAVPRVCLARVVRVVSPACMCCRNVSFAYRKMRQSDTSKRVKAIDVLANWVWPVVSVGFGFATVLSRRYRLSL
jgi:hypothetical protein